MRVSNPVPGGHPATKTSFWCQVKYETCRRTELSARTSRSWSPGLPLSIRSVPQPDPTVPYRTDNRRDSDQTWATARRLQQVDLLCGTAWSPCRALNELEPL